MKIKIIILLVTALAFVASMASIFFKNKENIILTGFGTTQWDLYKSYYKDIVASNYAFKPGKIFHEVGVYELSLNGTCNYYLVNKHRQLERFEVSDVITSKTWKYKNDSTFMLNGSDYKTLYFSKDSIVLLWNNPNWIDTSILVRSKKIYINSNNVIND